MSSSDDDWDKSISTQDYVVVICAYLIVPIMIFITAIFLNKYCKHKKTTMAASAPESDAAIKLITRVSIAAIFLYLATALLITITLTKWILIDQEHGIAVNNLLAHFSVLPYQFNLFISLFFILAQRLNHLLKSRCIHVVSYVLPSTAFIVCIVARNIARWTAPELNVILTKLNGYFVIFFLLIYLVFAVIYVCQISKMMKIRIDENMKIRSNEMKLIEMNENKTTSHIGTDEEKPNEVLVTFKTVEDTIRCALLVMICALSCFILPICISIGVYRHPHHTDTLALLGGLIDLVINTVCIFLLFGFAQSDYLKVCGVCHRCILTACLNRETKRFKKANVDLKDLQTHDQIVSLIVDDFATETR